MPRKHGATVVTAKLYRPTDTGKGVDKINHYIDLYKYYGELPPDIPVKIRNEKDIPITYKKMSKKWIKLDRPRNTSEPSNGNGDD